MKTLEQIKKDKNWLACKKGYPIDPEGFPLWFLYQRLEDEYKEFNQVFVDYQYNDNMIDEAKLFELADMSNIIDYIATKIITKYPDKYKPPCRINKRMQSQGE
jgi:hypothetical protein